MGIIQMKIVVIVAGFVLIFLTGYWLHRDGQHKLSTDLGGSNLSVPAGEQPFNAGVLTLHKLVSLAAIVYLVVTVLNISKMAPLGKVELIACIITGVLFLGAVASGGILSAARDMPVVVQTLHKALSVLTVLSAIAMFLLFRRR